MGQKINITDQYIVTGLLLHFSIMELLRVEGAANEEETIDGVSGEHAGGRPAFISRR
jgi:hypothetical protein